LQHFDGSIVGLRALLNLPPWGWKGWFRRFMMYILRTAGYDPRRRLPFENNRLRADVSVAADNAERVNELVTQAKRRGFNMQKETKS